MSDTSDAMTPAERQKLRRDRLKADGFTQQVVWVHKGDTERFEAFKNTLVRPDPHADRHHE